MTADSMGTCFRAVTIALSWRRPKWLSSAIRSPAGGPPALGAASQPPRRSGGLPWGLSGLIHKPTAAESPAAVPEAWNAKSSYSAAFGPERHASAHRSI